ncbi:hypothetical protein MTE01_24980 [Microbacterium testaceum]|uniref:Uncharacterized protein n=1 Tax=Microbacterium testaceum TaxID=2033 RepID=A0A4Y3QPG8_MICTE|nr:hypothetical protein MTE01_24980 [Microbacterium testaceum]
MECKRQPVDSHMHSSDVEDPHALLAQAFSSSVGGGEFSASGAITVFAVVVPPMPYPRYTAFVDQGIGMQHRDHSQQMKTHAQRRDLWRRHPLWVYDPDDWKLITGSQTGDLICPKPGCRAELVKVQRSNGTRFLRNRPGTVDCGHAFGRVSRGGPPSAEHTWLQQRLAMLCADLGYAAFPEYAHADVWVDGPRPHAIEVQRWTTDFAARTSARRHAGADVIWLLPESATSPQLKRALFRQPAARLRVFQAPGRSVEARPWEPGHTGRVRLWVGATVMRMADDGRSLTSAGNYDAREFLREVLSGERLWYGPNAVGFAYGSGWARVEDVAAVRAVHRRPARPRVQTEPAAAATTGSPPSPQPSDRHAGNVSATPPSPQAEPTVTITATERETAPSADIRLTPTDEDATPPLSIDGAGHSRMSGDSSQPKRWIHRLLSWLFH